jgi:hypothetical protein
MTEASRQALANLRDASHVSWYVVPLLALALYVYAVDAERRNWNAVFAGLAFWAMDWLNEIANGLILYATDRSALWTAPGDTAYLILVGLNIEICFMFSIAGIVVTKLLPRDKSLRVLGLPNRLFVGLAMSVFSVIVEIFLNGADMLIWEYSFWGVPHVWLIIVFGYLHFHLVAFWVYDMDDVGRQMRVVGALWAVVIVSLAVFGGALGWI